MSLVSSIFKFLQFNKKNWKAVVLCLLAATVFWFFNKLNKTYTTTLSVPLEFEYDQDNFVPVVKLPEDIKLNVTGNGWTLLRRSAGVKVASLLFPLEHPHEVKKIVGSTLLAFFSNQLTDLQINFVVTDTLWVDIEPNDGRWLTLTAEAFKDNFKKGYGLTSNPVIYPDSVLVQGPRRIVEQLIEPYPLPISERNIDENFETTLEVPFANERLMVEPFQVSVSFGVGKLKEIKDSLTVEVINIPRRMRPAINIRQIHYVLQLPEGLSYAREEIKAKVDLKELKSRKTKLAPTVSGIPPFSQIIQIDSVYVSY
jgi:hypothetical protein